VAIISKNGTMTTENRYLWCGDNLCQSRMATDVVNWRSYPQGEVRPLGNTLLYFSRDHLGSVRDVLTVQAGVRIATYDYDAYGKPTYDVGRLSTNFRYAGMFYLEEAGLYLTQYRVYDPKTGRWLSRDPIGEMGGVNLYGYVGGNPVNAIDPDGRIPIVGIGLRLLAVFMPMIDLQMMAVDDVPGWGGKSCSFTEGRLALPSLQVPNAGGRIVSDVTTIDQTFFRVFSGNTKIGGFLTAVPPRSSAFAQETLALPKTNSATFIQEVLVPAGTRIQRSRALPIRQADDLFPLRRGGSEQFQLLDRIPIENFGPGVPLP
jgi:RHS repeat-associated protein